MWIPFRINGRELDWAILPDKPNRRLVIRSRTGDYALEATIESGLWDGLWLRTPRLLGTEFPLGQRAPIPPPEFSERYVPYLHTELVRSLVERWAHRKSDRIKPRDRIRLARKTVPRDVIITSEQDWIGTNDIHAMLRVFQENASARKWRLLAVASCHRIRHLMNVIGGHAIDLAERFADDEVSIDELKTALKEIAAAQPAAHGDRTNVALSWALSAATTAADPEPRRHSCLNFADARLAAGEHEYAQFGPHRKHRARIAVQREGRAQALLIRDIAGNPYSPPKLHPSSLSHSVVALARIIYTEKSFHLLPQLAEELQTTGCDEASVIEHCYSSLPHVRGCWVVDQVLGKC